MSTAVAEPKTEKKQTAPAEARDDVPTGTILNLAGTIDLRVAQQLYEASGVDSYRAQLLRTFLYDAKDEEAYLVSTDTYRLFRAKAPSALPGPVSLWKWLQKPKPNLMLVERSGLDYPDWRRTIPGETRPVGLYQMRDGCPTLQIVGEVFVRTDLLPLLTTEWTVHRCVDYKAGCVTRPFHQPYVFRSRIGEMILMPTTPLPDVLALLQPEAGK